MYFQCPDGQWSVATDAISGAQIPECASGQGAWVPEPSSLTAYSVDMTQAGALWGAIIFVLVLAFSIKAIRKVLWPRL